MIKDKFNPNILIKVRIITIREIRPSTIPIILIGCNQYFGLVHPNRVALNALPKTQVATAITAKIANIVRLTPVTKPITKIINAMIPSADDIMEFQRVLMLFSFHISFFTIQQRTYPFTFYP